MESEYDIVILGAGCAGLSLAMRLARLGQDCPRIVLLEQRESYVHDRTWSYWASDSAQLRHLAKCEWRKAIIGRSQHRVTVDCHQVPYQTIQSGDFYRLALAEISKNSRVELILGESIETVLKKNNRWEVTTKKGATRGLVVIDTRPAKREVGNEPQLWQSFSGVEVECEREVFDAQVATLMDFVDDDSGEIRFLYLLPFSGKCALIEATVFSEKAKSQSDLAPILDRLLKRSVGDARFVIKYREQFVIPMGLADSFKSEDESYVRVGVESGSARASTGYVFQRIQHWAEEMASRVAQGKKIVGPARDPWILRKMDSLFLRVLQRYPERGPEIFVGLFSLRDSGVVIRFMNDEPTFLDIVRIMCALPFGIFIKELGREIFR